MTQELAAVVEKESAKLWNIHYINTLSVTLLVNIASIILITLLPLYTMSLGGNNIVAGTLMTIFTISALLFRPVFGSMLDYYGRRVVLILGLCLFGVAALALLLAHNITLVFILRFVQGIGLSAYSTALGTILSDVVPSHKISEGVGYFGVAATVAMAIGPSMGLYLCDQFGYQITYAVTFGISLIGAGFACFINYETKHENPGKRSRTVEIQERGRKSNNAWDFIEVTALRPCIVIIFTVIAISSVFSFMPLFGKERNIPNIGLFFTCYAASMIAARLVIGRIADKYGHRKIYLPAAVITLFIFVTLIFADSLGLVLLAAVFYGVGYGTVQPIINTMIIKRSPEERMGAANATYYATMDIGFGLGSFVWGTVSQEAGFTAVFIGCAGCAAFSILLYFLLLHTNAGKNRVQY